MSRTKRTLLGAIPTTFFAAQVPLSGQDQVRESQASNAPPNVQEINDSFVAKLQKQIAGREQEPAEKVFKNIQNMKAAPAGRFLLIMNLGYSKALGVACTYCHVESDFSSDDKRPKRAAREMAAMHSSINQQLAKMQNLAPNPQGHFINCATSYKLRQWVAAAISNWLVARISREDDPMKTA